MNRLLTTLLFCFVLILSSETYAQTIPPKPSTPGQGPSSGVRPPIDLPFEQPSDEPTEKNYPQPIEPEEPEEPPTFGGEPIPTENQTIFYVVDTSCSMGWDSRSYVDDDGNTRSGPRIDRAKAELRKSILALPKSFRFNLLGYGCSIRMFQGSMVRATPPNKGAAIGWVNGLYPSDGTMTGPATARALSDKENKSVVLLTDGSPNCGASGMSGHKSQINGSNTQ